MDERHWWLAGKIAECFQSPEDVSAVERFICMSPNIEMINNFFGINGQSRLFVYQSARDRDSLDIYQVLKLSDGGSSAAKIADSPTVLYFLRHSTELELELGHFEREVFCGVLRGGRASAVENFQFLLQNVYAPIVGVHAASMPSTVKGDAGKDRGVQLHLKKLATSLSDSGLTFGPVVRPVMLKKAVGLVTTDVTSHKLTQLDEKTVADLEGLLSDWINTIESNIADNDCDRIHDQFAGPLAELQRWRRRERLLMSIADQLKSKESKFIIFALAACKSKMSKKWRQTDAALTDAINDTKDKVRFLESLERHFEQFYNGTSPMAILNTVLPSLVNAIVSVESVSKFYAQQGFLGLLFTKITNQLVVVCKKFISECTTSDANNKDQLWYWACCEVTSSDATSLTAAVHDGTVNASETNKRQTLNNGRLAKSQLASTNHGLRERLEAVIALYTGYCDALFALRNMLVSSRNYARDRPKAESDGEVASGAAGKGADTLSGVSLSDVGTIVHYFEMLTLRVRKFLDAIGTLKKFHNVVRGCGYLPWPTELDFEDATVAMHRKLAQQRKLQQAAGNDQNADVLPDPEQPEAEADDELSGNSPRSGWVTNDAPSEQDLKLLRTHCDPETGVENKTVADTLQSYFSAMNACLEDSLTTRVFLDMHGKDKDQFAEIFQDFSSAVQDMEDFIIAYLRVVFMRKMKIQEALNLIKRFSSVQRMSRLEGPILAQCATIFNDYTAELKLVQQIFDKHKSDPQLFRDAPPVAGAIAWSRQLLRRVKEPMAVFSQLCSPASAHLCGFDSVLDLHNHTAANLATFETLLMAKWKSSVDRANTGLRARLLRPSDRSKFHVIVNADNSVLELVRECRYMQRLGVKLPQSAIQILQQEVRFKNYRDQLQLAVDAFHSACSRVPDALIALFEPHTEIAFSALLPGITALDWTSTNIDVFVHKIHSSANRLQSIVSTVHHLMLDPIGKSISQIESTLIIDPEFITSRTWTSQMFVEEIRQSVENQAHNISGNMSSIESGINSIAWLLYIKEKKAIKAELWTTETIKTFLIKYYTDAIQQAVRKAVINTLIRISKLAQIDQASDKMAELIGPRGLSFLLDNSSLGNQSEIQTTGSSDSARLQIEVQMHFKIPEITLDPHLESMQSLISSVLDEVINSPQKIKPCCDQQLLRNIVKQLQDDALVKAVISNVTKTFADTETAVKGTVQAIVNRYSFLWADDARSNFSEILSHDGPNGALHAVKREADRLVIIEQQIAAMPKTVSIGAVCLYLQPVRETLLGLTLAWKNLYTSALLERAQAMKASAIEYRSNVAMKLDEDVVTLEQLNETLGLLNELRDMEGKVDELYRPIEDMYAILRAYEPRLSRSSCSEVDELREEWHRLIIASDRVTSELLREKRVIFEQELDKQIKAFVLEVIQFRNTFEARGPTVSGISPTDAADRLADFTLLYQSRARQRRTLESVARLFSISCRPFPELDRTGEELTLLNQLFEVYLPFLSFDASFRNTLWSDVDLSDSHLQAEFYWNKCAELPSKLRDVDAYQTMELLIHRYVRVFPVLHQLASKEIRNRHWLRVMQVTSSSFQLEAHIFKMTHLLDIGLDKHVSEINDICKSAKFELELEIELKSIEDQWTEQALSFHSYSASRCSPADSVPVLDVEATRQLIIKLDSAGVRLATVLTSPYVAPLYHNAAFWALKVKFLGATLDQWLNIQEQWICLTEIFSDPAVSQNMQVEAAKFQVVVTNWIKLMSNAYHVKNILQCCSTDGVAQLPQMSADLDACTKSLAGYLALRRQIFPRLYFISDMTLLQILSKADYIEAVKPSLRILFSDVMKIHSASVLDGNDEERRKVHNDVAESVDNMTYRTVTTGVTNSVGEVLQLKTEVVQDGGVECWLAALKQSIADTLCSEIRELTSDTTSAAAIEDWAYKHTSQTCCMALLALWTRECETATGDLRSDRSALSTVSKRFMSLLGRLQSVRARSTWRNNGEKLTPSQKICLDAMIIITTRLHETVESVSRGKVQDVGDFEWRRNVRVYLRQEDTRPIMALMDHEFPYGCEFLSSTLCVQALLLSERTVTSLSLSLIQFKGSIVTGDSMSVDMIKDFAALLGQHVAMVQCTERVEAGMIGSVVEGASREGCWACFKDVHNLGQNGSMTKAVLVNHVESVLRAIRSSLDYCYLYDEHEILVRRTFSVFLTLPVNATEIPDDRNNMVISADMRSMFREVSLVAPDARVILRAYIARAGLRSPAVLAQRLKMVSSLVQDQLPGEAHQYVGLPSLLAVVRYASNVRQYSRVVVSVADVKKLLAAPTRQKSNMSRQTTVLTKSDISVISKPTGNVIPKRGSSLKILSAAARHEHALIGQLLIEIIGPRFLKQHSIIFSQIVRDVFPGMPEFPRSVPTAPNELRRNVPATISSSNIHVGESRSASLAKATLSSRGLVPHKPWCQKCHHLQVLSAAHIGVVVVGPSASGKSSIIQAVVDAPNITSPTDTKAPPGNIHKLVQIYPLASDDLTLIFGATDSHGKWTDGILTDAWKRAARDPCTTWLCLDGPLTPNWADHFITVLDDTKALSLDNGDRLTLPSNLRLLFETDDLSVASPAIVSRSGILYVDKDTVGWRPIAKTWLNARTLPEAKVLNRIFEQVVDAALGFVMKDYRHKPLPVTEVGLFTVCLRVLSAMLADNVEIGGDLHIERLFLFCLMWTVGGLLDSNAQKGFSDLLITLSPAMPDDDRDICIFDYYVDEAGEWDPWVARIPQATFNSEWNLLGGVFVDTIDSVRAKMLITFALASGQGVLLVGPPGSGKTALISEFLGCIDQQMTVVRRLTASHSTSAHQLQKFVDSSVVHRQGVVYGARDKKKLHLFVDDISLPSVDEFGVQRFNELLRRLVGENVICTTSSPFECHSVEGVTCIASMNISTGGYLSSTQHVIHPRLLRHFAVISLPMPNKTTLKDVVYNILEAAMLYGGSRPGLEIDLHNSLVSASIALLSAVSQVLRPSPTPGRTHYQFTLQSIVSCFESFKLLADESCADDKLVVSLWKHEMENLIRDQLCRHAEQKWFDAAMKTVVDENWLDLSETLHQHFIRFPIHLVQHPFSSHAKADVKVILQPVESMDAIRSCIAAHLSRYNEKFGNVKLDVMLTDNALKNIVRLHRVLTLEHSGSALLVSPIGANHSRLVRLALHVAGLTMHSIQSSSFDVFVDGLRSAVRLAGTEGRRLVIYLTERNMMDGRYLDAINSLLASGEYPFLFTNEELDSLLLALVPLIKRKYPNQRVNAMDYFISCVKRNLRFVISVPPDHQLLATAISAYPGFLTGCQLIWMCDWTKEALTGEAEFFLEISPDVQEIASMRVPLAKALANIHSTMLVDCRQNVFVGEISAEADHSSEVVLEDKRIESTYRDVSAHSLPYSKLIAIDRIKWNHRTATGEVARGDIFIGPSIYWRFVNTFVRVYSSVLLDRRNKIAKIQQALRTLDNTRQDSRQVKDLIASMDVEFKKADGEVNEIQRKLTVAVARLEVVKATALLKRNEAATSSLETFLQMNEPALEQSEYVQLEEDEKDDYDAEFDRMRAATMKSRQEKATEELVTTAETIEDLKKKLLSAREQSSWVQLYQTFQNQVVEIVVGCEVILWRSRVTRQVIDNLKSYQKPNQLVGHIIEMAMVLVGCRPSSLTGGGHARESPIVYPNGEEQSGKFSQSSGSTNAARKNRVSVIEPLTDDRYDRQQWKTMQQTMSDSNKYLDLLHSVPWQEGLPTELIAALEGYLAKEEDGPSTVNGETLLSGSPPETDRSSKAQRRPVSWSNEGGITIAAAKRSSEDAVTLVQYLIAIVKFSRLHTTQRLAVEKQKALQNELAEHERRLQDERIKESEAENTSKEPVDPDLNTDDVTLIQKKVDELHLEYDAAIVTKHKLNDQLDVMKKQLTITKQIIYRLKQQEAHWKSYIGEASDSEAIVADSVLAAAFLTYCGGLDADLRAHVAKLFLAVCEHHQLVRPQSTLFQRCTLADFFSNRVNPDDLEERGLPYSELMLENACLVLHGHLTMTWPLLCDSTLSAITWISGHLKDSSLVVVKYSKSDHDDLLKCLTEGHVLLLTHVDVETLCDDGTYLPVILACETFHHASATFKLSIGDEEIDCNPGFRLFMHTSTSPHLIPAQLSAYTSLVDFHPSRMDIENKLLDVFVSQEKSRIVEESTTLLKERRDLRLKLQQWDAEILKILVDASVKLVDDGATAARLNNLKNSYDEAIGSWEQLRSSLRDLNHLRETYRSVASRGAVCWDCTRHMRCINPLYESSFDQFLRLFEGAIAHSDRMSMKSLLDRVVSSAYLSTNRFLLEFDKPIYALLLAIELEDSERRVGVGEREFLISPAFGSLVMAAAYRSPDSATDKKYSKIKPFDWMLDEQYGNLLLLATHYEWFRDAFERMTRDGRETQWRALCESDQPELMPLPDPIDNSWTALRRLLVVRAVRDDRLLQLGKLFVAGVLGKRYTLDIPVDMSALVKHSSTTIPILVMFTKDADAANSIVTHAATQRNVKLLAVALTDESASLTSQLQVIERLIQDAMVEGSWLLLQNGHKAPVLLDGLDTILERRQRGSLYINSQFRCLVTAQWSGLSNKLAPRLLQHWVKVTIDPPKTIKNTLLRAFTSADMSDFLKASSRPDWPAILHNVCFLHGALRLRASLAGRSGWNIPGGLAEIGVTELFDSLRAAVGEYQDNDSTDVHQQSRIPLWSGLRFLLSEVVYGNSIRDSYDQKAMSAVVDYWISQHTTKKDFLISKLKYKLPASFFTTPPRLQQLIQGLEAIPSQLLETPEACNIYLLPTEADLGTDQYIFTRLNKVFDEMPTSASLKHDLFVRPPAPLSVVAPSNISASSNRQEVLPLGVSASASQSLMRLKKEIDLSELASIILAKVSRFGVKDVEKLRLSGGSTSFNLFLLREVETMNKLIDEIRSSLQAIKSACESSSLGDTMSDHDCQVADDLYHVRIPKHWRELSAGTGMPAGYELGLWLADLQNRCSHIDRIVNLGRDKMPAYWLGAFFHPRGLLSLLVQESCRRQVEVSRTGGIEACVFQTELTQRDKDHIRDPPANGMYIYGLYLWGGTFDKSSSQLVDPAAIIPGQVASGIPSAAVASRSGGYSSNSPPIPSGPNPLPVIHVTCWPRSERPIPPPPDGVPVVSASRSGATAAELDNYACPVYPSRAEGPRQVILELELPLGSTSAARWIQRGLQATVRPY